MKKEWLVKTLAIGIVVLFILVSFNSVVGIQTFKPTGGYVPSKESLIEIQIWFFGTLSLPIVVRNVGDIIYSHFNISISVKKNSGKFNYLGRTTGSKWHIEFPPGAEEVFAGPWAIGLGTINVTVQVWASDGGYWEAHGIRFVFFIFTFGFSQFDDFEYIG